MALTVGAACVPHGLSASTVPAAVPPPVRSRHISELPPAAGLCEMMGTAGSVEAPQEPPYQAEPVPTFPGAPLQQ